MIKFMQYTGTKFFMIDLYKKLESQITAKVYCEPFIGSGSIFFNAKEFDKYIINDINPHLIKIYEAFKKIDSFESYIDLISKVFKEFDVKNSKEDYYEFRSYTNSLKDSTEETKQIEYGVYLHLLANSCINSMFRTGPNGFNQAWGNRCRYFQDKEEFQLIQSRLSRAEIYNVPYQELLINDKDIFYFLDPPYLEGNKRVGYNGFNSEKFLEFIDIVKNLESEFLYTDTIKDENAFIPNIPIRKYQTIAPSIRKDQKENLSDERLFTSQNFKLDLGLGPVKLF